MIAQRLIALAMATVIACTDDGLTPPTPLRHGSPDFNHAIPQATIVLRGTILTPDGAITHGYVGISDGRIVSVSQKDPAIPGSVTINTYGIIAPGFVDVHNHVPWNVIPRWDPERVFTNQPEWNADSTYRATVRDPFNRLIVANACDMHTWGELRALVGGTTATMTSRPIPCIHGLVRNLDFNSEFYGTTQLDRERLFNVPGIPPASDLAGRAQFVGAAQFFIANPFWEALFVHVAEGTDSVAQEEFTFLQSQNLLNAKGAIIHGISLRASDFAAMASAGTALVWSPRSNLKLNGTTADVGAALDAGVEIALAPDWAITGSSNLLDEMKVASSWNVEQLGGRLSDRKLFDMVTSIPAQIAGVDDEVGAIRVGLRADLVVLRGDHNEPFGAVIGAAPEDVQLVMIGGIPLYGDVPLMMRFWERSDIEELTSPLARKALASAATGISVSALASRLAAALQGEGMTLASLAEPSAGQRE